MLHTVVWLFYAGFDKILNYVLGAVNFIAWAVNFIAWAINHGAVSAVPNWQKALSKLLIPKAQGLLDRDLNEAPCTTILSLEILPYPSHIGLPGFVSLCMLYNASRQITLSVPDVVDTENWINSSLLFLLDSCSTTMTRSLSPYSLQEVRILTPCSLTADSYYEIAIYLLCAAAIKITRC